MPFNSGTVGSRQPPPAMVRLSTQALASYQLLSALGLTYHSRPVRWSVITPLSALVNLGWLLVSTIWASREPLMPKPHTINKIKAIMLKRYQRAMFKPPRFIG